MVSSSLLLRVHLPLGGVSRLRAKLWQQSPGILFASWGPCPSASFCRPDLDRDGAVDGADLWALLVILGDPKACD